VTEIPAAGAVLWRPGTASSAVEIALVHRPKYDDWSLPKGKLEPGESIWAAAARETAEETGFSATLGRYLGRVEYGMNKPAPATKTVDYFAARTRSGRFEPNREVDQLRWMAPAQAPNLLSYAHDHDIVRKFAALPANLTTLALVRHAVAGRREEWPGPDELRPLTGKGWQDAKALAALLPLFGVDTVHSAPVLRCTQTVAALRDDLGVEIVIEPLLAERGYTAAPAAGMARLYEIVAGGGTPMVCSQGGVIPDVLTRLAADSGLALENPQAAKGSVWVLSFTGETRPRLVDAHYIDKP
jgi:8-oxo-(d)GTP phosphatase